MTGNNRDSIRADTAKIGSVKHGIGRSYPLGRTRLFGIYCSSFRVLQLLVEFSLLSIILFVALKIIDTGQTIPANFPSSASGLGMFISLVIIVCMGCMGLYSTKQSMVTADLLQRLSIAFLFSSLVLLCVYWSLNWDIALIETFGVPVAVAFLLLFIGRLGTEKLIGRDSIMKKVLILGDGERADQVFDRLDTGSGSAYSLHRLTVVNDVDAQDIGRQVIELVSKYEIGEIVLAYQEKRQMLPVSVLLECKLSGVVIRDPIEFLERESGLIDFDFLDFGWMVFADGFSSDRLGMLAKRLLDIICGLLLLLVTSPLFLLSAIAIKTDKSSNGPIFYKQKRVGLGGRLFDVWKFRSMYSDAEADGNAKWAIENDSRITAIGSKLRKYRIDELPQLFNVLKGEMSLVGPRPERPEFVSQLTELHVLYSDRHRVKPGLTGWAQMRFPYTSSSDDSIKKLQYDMYYVKNRSLLLDFLILLQTVEVVLCGKGSR